MQSLNAFTAQNIGSLHKFLDQIAVLSHPSNLLFLFKGSVSNSESSLSSKEPRVSVLRMSSYKDEEGGNELDSSNSNSAEDTQLQELDIEASNSPKGDQPELLKTNKKVMKMTRNKMMHILFAYSVALASDITTAIHNVDGSDETKTQVCFALSAYFFIFTTIFFFFSFRLALYAYASDLSNRKRRHSSKNFLAVLH